MIWALSKIWRSDFHVRNFLWPKGLNVAILLKAFTFLNREQLQQQQQKNDSFVVSAVGSVF